MTEPVCASPTDWETLLAYRLGELDPEREARVEEHYLGCALCSRRLAQLEALARAVRALTRTGGVDAVVNEAFVRGLRDSGLQVREYRLPHNGSVNCTVAPDDDLVVARLEAPLGNAKRIDLVTLADDVGYVRRQEDVPFRAESGGILFTARIDTLRALPETTLDVQLLAVDDSGERMLGGYRFNHTPYTSRRS